MIDDKSNPFKTGQTVSNPVATVQWANFVTLVIGVITSALVILHTFGVKFALSDSQIAELATALVSLVSFGRILISKITRPEPTMPPAITGQRAECMYKNCPTPELCVDKCQTPSLHAPKP
jgi:hypothetical protein